MHLKPWWWYVINQLIAYGILLWLLAAATAKKERIPGRLQGAFEHAFEGLRSMFLGSLGEHGAEHLPLIFAIFFYILIGNFLGMVPGLVSPTASTSSTIGLGLVVFVYIQYVGIKSNGLLGYFKHFLGPVLWLIPLMLPIELIGEIAKPFSLGMRLFGNLFGEDQLVELAKGIGGSNIVFHLIPNPILLAINCLQVFTNIVQAFIFALLTCAYIAMMTTHHHDEGDAYDPEPHHEDRIEEMKESLAGLGGNL